MHITLGDLHAMSHDGGSGKRPFSRPLHRHEMGTRAYADYRARGLRGYLYKRTSTLVENNPLNIGHGKPNISSPKHLGSYKRCRVFRRVLTSSQSYQSCSSSLFSSPTSLTYPRQQSCLSLLALLLPPLPFWLSPSSRRSQSADPDRWVRQPVSSRRSCTSDSHLYSRRH